MASRGKKRGVKGKKSGGHGEKKPMPYRIWPPIQTPALAPGDSFHDARAKWLTYLRRVV